MEGANALNSATMNGTSCAGGAANTTVNDALNTLNNCSFCVEEACEANDRKGLLGYPPESFNFRQDISVCNSTCATAYNSTKMVFEVRNYNLSQIEFTP